jgi:hypothetical protein
VGTLDALHTQAETARHLAEDKKAHHLMIVCTMYMPEIAWPSRGTHRDRLRLRPNSRRSYLQTRD